MAAVATLHEVFDESFARDSIPALKAAGWTDAIRYATGAGKAITSAEAQAFIAAGMTVTLVQERGDQPALGGYAAGATDAKAANAAADAVGMPRGAQGAIYYVGDDPAPLPAARWPAVVSYFTAVRDVHAASGRRIGCYGSGPQINNTRRYIPQVTLEWCVRTWGLSAHPNLIQEPNTTLNTLGHTIDANTAVGADWGQWPFAAAPSAPAAVPPPTVNAYPIFGGPMPSFIASVPVGPNGEGWAVFDGGIGSDPGSASLSPAVPWSKFVAATPWCVDPAHDPDRPSPNVGVQVRGGWLFVRVSGGAPGNTAAAYITYTP